MARVSDVLDCWFESGSMPNAQNHYPFENKEFVTQFPGDFHLRGIGPNPRLVIQLVTRGRLFDNLHSTISCQTVSC
jgi:hypothetical protein